MEQVVTNPKRRRSPFVAAILLLFLLGLIVGRILSNDPEPAAAVLRPITEPSPAPQPTPPAISSAPVQPPPDVPETADREEPMNPVRLALTSYLHSTGVAEGSVLRACGITDLPEGAKLAYEIVPTSPGDSGWVRERQFPHLYEGSVTLGADQSDRGLRTFCFQADVYASCGMEPFHPLNCPLHVSVWFSSTLTGLSFSQTQPESVLEQFGVLGERIAASEDCDLATGCGRLRETDPRRIEYSERVFDACPPSMAGCLPR